MIKEEYVDVKIEPLSPVRKNKKGQIVHKRERLIIINVYKALKEEKPTITKKDAYTILSKRTGFGIFSIKKTILQYERTGNVTSPEKRGPRITCNKRVNEFDRNAIRRKIHEFYLNKELPTLAKILQAVNTDEKLPNFKRTNFWKLLKELNFTFAGRQRNSVLIERNDLVLWRRRYLKDIQKYRKEGRPIYYLDETWVNTGDVSSMVWMDTTIKTEKDAFPVGLTTGPSNTIGKGERLIVLHIGSETGFVPGRLLCIESKKNSADYRVEMNGDRFFEWFENTLPSLEDNAVIVMDNAPHHSMKVEKVPDSSWEKGEIINWLHGKNKEADTEMLKAELLEIVASIKHDFDKYLIDQKAKEHNKTVLRLPPYHCELNPIEMAWSMVKHYINSNNSTSKLNDVKLLVEQGVQYVKSEHWENFLRHVLKEEKKFWEVDEISDRMIDEMPPLTIDDGANSDFDTDWSDG